MARKISHILWLFCAILLALLMITIPVMADGYTTYRLNHIEFYAYPMNLPSDSLVHVDDMHADSNGGYFKYTVKSDDTSPQCKGASTQFTMEWTFDKDISVLSGNHGDILFTAYGQIKSNSDVGSCINAINIGITPSPSTWEPAFSSLQGRCV